LRGNLCVHGANGLVALTQLVGFSRHGSLQPVHILAQIGGGSVPRGLASCLLEDLLPFAVTAALRGRGCFLPDQSRQRCELVLRRGCGLLQALDFVVLVLEHGTCAISLLFHVAP
jgi:hypothetical protein